MTKFSTLNKSAMIAMMIASVGIPVSLASAQFKVEHSVKDEKKTVTIEKAPKADKKVSMSFHTDDGEHSYEIKLVNGEVIFATIDDDKVPNDQIKVSESVIVFMGEDGKTLHEFKVPNAPHALHTIVHGVRAPHADHPHEEHEIHEWVSDGAEGGTFTLKELKELKGQDKDSKVSYSFTTAPQAKNVAFAVEPKVMLGINLSEPSAALRKHLRLDDSNAILIERVIEGLPAQLAGLEDFDVIISLDGSDEADGELLSEVLSEKEAGDILKVVLLRAGEKVKVKVELAEYDAEALSSVVVSGDFTFQEDEDENVFFSNKADSNIRIIRKGQTREMEQLHREAEQHVKDAYQQRELAEVMRAKAMEAMRDVERQIVEFKDGKLVVRTTEELHEQLADLTENMSERFPEIETEVVESHMEEMEERFEELEERLDEQLERMGDHIERLTEMFERLMESLEEDD
jgi:membrane-associated protease RseP (regulator of RpoE activity)